MTQAAATLAPILICPKCKKAVQCVSDGWSCGEHIYGEVGGVPILRDTRRISGGSPIRAWTNFLLEWISFNKDL